MEFTWINHASFLLKTGGVRLVADPWLEAAIFSNSWDLLCKSRFQPADFAGVTYIWISHEHPDHFSPATLRSIPPETRRNITVLIQPTRDRKVLEYCRGLGFGGVEEVPAGTWLQIAPDVEIMVQPEKMDDSWLAVRAEGRLVLNLNDCLLTSDVELKRIALELGQPVDVLLTQFSFAAWIGNQGDVEAHRRSRREALERITVQTRVLAPRWVIPCASFVWFCHEENAYMNRELNKVHDVVAHLRAETHTTPIVMYPGDRWQPGTKADPTPQALERYAEEYASIPSRPLLKSQSVEIETLAGLADNWRKRLLSFHGLPLLLLHYAHRLPPTFVWLKDAGVAARLSLGGLVPIFLMESQCDMAMTSEALGQFLGQMYGGMTLVISGRFQSPSGSKYLGNGGTPPAFRRYVTFADDANHGWPVWRELLFRLWSKLPGVCGSDWLVRHTPPHDRPPPIEQFLGSERAG